MNKKALTTSLNSLGHDEWFPLLAWVAERFNGIDLVDISTDPNPPTLINDLVIIAENASRSTHPVITLTNQLSQMPYWTLRVSKKRLGQTEYWSPLDCNYCDFADPDESSISWHTTSYPAPDIVRHRLRQIIKFERCI